MSRATLRRPAARGFTLVELMVVVAITAIVLSLAAPSFTSFLAKKRVESVMSELSTDLQYARSEAVSRNAAVRITFDTSCYVITAQPSGSTPTSSCSQTADPTLGAGATNVKQVQLKSGATAQFSTTSSPFYLEFDPVRGIATFSTGATSGTVNVNSTVSSAQLQAYVSTVGRVCITSPSGMSGYAASCP